jgi:hypothetical protein
VLHGGFAELIPGILLRPLDFKLYIACGIESLEASPTLWTLFGR